MTSTCTTKEIRWLVQVECKWCDELNRDNFKQKLYMACNLWEEAPLPSLYYILCLSTWATSKRHFFLGFPSGSPKTNFYYPKTLDDHIFFKLSFFEHTMAISYSFQKDLSNSVLHAPIGDHLTLALKGFVV
jgi:hypothetical protein